MSVILSKIKIKPEKPSSRLRCLGNPSREETSSPVIRVFDEKFAQRVDVAAGGAKQLLFTLDLKPDFRAKRAPGLSTGGYR